MRRESYIEMERFNVMGSIRCRKPYPLIVKKARYIESFMPIMKALRDGQSGSAKDR